MKIISNKLSDLYQKIENEQTFKYEKVAFFLFCFFVILVSFFHEPWYDEFQSWGISKDSLYNILFVIPHYEGHPPLWHLIIKCFSIFNINPELCIKIPNTIFISLCSWLLIFKSPFPKAVRIFLPFTYFIFYQYGIISRPYSLFVLAIFLCAFFFNTRKTNPFRYICILALLSLSTAYGLLFTAGITIAWGLELIDFKNLKQSVSNLVKNRQFHAMLLLFIFCIILSAVIFPNTHNTAAPMLKHCQTWQKVLYCLFGFISDSTIFDILYGHQFVPSIVENTFSVYFVMSVIFGFCVNVLLIRIFKSTKTLRYFAIPYSMSIIFVYFVYFSPHHEGLLFSFIIFCFWISYDIFHLSLKQNDKTFLKIITIMTIIVQLSWSLIAGIADIFYTYEISREISNYIKKHELYNYRIYVGDWQQHYYVDKKGVPVVNEYIVKFIDQTNNGQYTLVQSDMTIMYLAVITIPYFNRNIFYNFNIDSPEKLYSIHTEKTESEKNEIMQKWRNIGLPDVIVGDTDLKKVWKDSNYIDDYIRIKTFPQNDIWKGRVKIYTYSTNLYMHKNLFKKLNFIQYMTEK